MSQNRGSRFNRSAVSRSSMGNVPSEGMGVRGRGRTAWEAGMPVAGTRSYIPFTFARHSVACERHPERNEDSLIIDERSGLVGVFDGVGGSARGEIASQTAARAIYLGWKRILRQMGKRHYSQCLFEDYGQLQGGTVPQDASPESSQAYLLHPTPLPPLHEYLRQLTLEADELVRTEGAQRAGTDDLATTVALAVLCRQREHKQHMMVYAHVGDSRIYLLREHEPLKRLTSDDGLLARLVENQIVNDVDAQRIDQAMHIDELSDLELSYFKLRGGITQALGGHLPPMIHIDQIPIQPGDRVLLCTDGIHDNLTDDEIEEILRTGPRTTVARLLVEYSILRSHEEREVTLRAKPDDMSAIVMTCRF